MLKTKMCWLSDFIWSSKSVSARPSELWTESIRCIDTIFICQLVNFERHLTKFTMEMKTNDHKHIQLLMATDDLRIFNSDRNFGLSTILKTFLK